MSKEWTSMMGCVWNSWTFFYPLYAKRARDLAEHDLECRVEAHDAQAVRLDIQAAQLRDEARRVLRTGDRVRATRLLRDHKTAIHAAIKARDVSGSCRMTLETMRQTEEVRDTVNALENARKYLREVDSNAVFARLDGISDDLSEARDNLNGANDLLRVPTSEDEDELERELQELMDLDLPRPPSQERVPTPRVESTPLPVASISPRAPPSVTVLPIPEHSPLPPRIPLRPLSNDQGSISTS